MARTVLDVEDVATTGLEPTVTAGTADGHEFTNDGKTILRLDNTGAGAHTTTIQTSATVGGLAVADLTVTIPAGEVREVGPFPTSIYGTTVLVDFDGTQAEVTVECKRVTPQ